MYELFIGSALLIATLIVVIVNRDDTLVYFLGIIGFSVLGFYVGLFSSIFIVSASGFVFGLLLRHIAHDELQPGKKWIMLIVVTSLLGLIMSLILGEMIYVHTSLFLLLLCLPSLVKIRKSKV